MNAFLESLLAQRIGWTLLHSLWEGVVVAAVAAIVLRVLSRATAALRYNILLGALGIIPIAGVATFLALEQSHAPESPARRVETLAPARNGFEFSANNSIPLVTDDSVRSTLTLADRAKATLPWIAAAWLIGVAMLSAYHALGWIGLLRMRLQATRLTQGGSFNALNRLRRTLRIDRAIALAESDKLDSPIQFGLLKPIILLPAVAMSGLSLAQVEALLAHELAHIRRHDYLVNLVQTAIETLLFYHPAAWWLSRRVRLERECATDDLAVAAFGDRITYAEALSVMERLRAPRNANVSFAVAARGGELLARIGRLAQRANPGSTSHRRVLAPVSVALLATAFVLAARPLLSRARTAIPSTQPSEPADKSKQPDPSAPKISVYDKLKAFFDRGWDGKFVNVDAEGFADLPILGRARVAGLRAEDVRNLYRKVNQNPPIIELSLRTQAVYSAMGCVNQPTVSVELPGNGLTSLRTAIETAGGLRPDADHVVVYRFPTMDGTKASCKHEEIAVRLEPRGTGPDDLPQLPQQPLITIQPGDIIFVARKNDPAPTIRANDDAYAARSRIVRGIPLDELMRKYLTDDEFLMGDDIYELKSPDYALRSLLKDVDKQTAADDMLVVLRFDERRIAIPRAVKVADVKSGRSDVKLQPRDLVAIMTADSAARLDIQRPEQWWVQGHVEVKGKVESEGTLSFRPGMTLEDCITLMHPVDGAASVTHVRRTENGPEIFRHKYDLYELLNRDAGKTELRFGDLIIVE